MQIVAKLPGFDTILERLRAHRYDESSEAAFQKGVYSVLFNWAATTFNSGSNCEIGLRPEHVLPGLRDRVDFYVERRVRGEGFTHYAIECKIKGSLSSVTRQLDRYAAHDCIDAIILVTTKMRHTHVPNELRGKPVRVVCTMGGIV